MNLPAGDSIITGSPGTFDLTDPLTYNHSTSVTVFDSLGDSHIMTYYFIKEDPIAAVAADPSATPPVAAHRLQTLGWFLQQWITNKLA